MEETLVIEADRSILQQHADELTKLADQLSVQYTKQRIHGGELERDRGCSALQFRLVTNTRHCLVKFSAVLVDAADFFAMVTGDGVANGKEGTLNACRSIDEYGKYLKRQFSGSRICLVVNGHKALSKRIDQAKKRRFRSAANDLEANSNEATAAKRKRKRDDPYANMDGRFVDSAVRNALAELQILHEIDSVCIESTSDLMVFVKESAVSALRFSEK